MKPIIFAGLGFFIAALVPNDFWVPGQSLLSQSYEQELCSSCHESGEESIPQIDPAGFRSSVHGEMACVECHLDTAAPHGDAVPSVECGSCHEPEASAYERSIHSREAGSHNLAAPTCVGCHGSHEIRPAESPRSAVNHAEIDETCGRCHSRELQDFQRSIHSEALRDAGLSEYAPTCNTCHGEHDIFLSRAPASPVSSGKLPGTCGGCHDDPRLAEKLGIPGGRLSTYSATIHGLRNRFGVENVATCVDCHGAHAVLPGDNPDSTISPANLVATCGRCHANANENFVQSRIHIEAAPESSLGVFIVRWFYIIFIGVLGIGFVVHIFFDFVSLRRRRREGKDAK
jgi:nitrate/TMAO reductase-like tetraheme cytochrome c subunit